MSNKEQPLAQGWHEDEKGRAFFYLQGSDDLRPAFEQMIAGQPPTEDEWLWLMLTFIDFLSRRGLVLAPEPSFPGLRLESRDELLARFSDDPESLEALLESLPQEET